MKIGDLVCIKHANWHRIYVFPNGDYGNTCGEMKHGELAVILDEDDRYAPRMVKILVSGSSLAGWVQRDNLKEV